MTDMAIFELELLLYHGRYLLLSQPHSCSRSKQFILIGLLFKVLLQHVLLI